MCTVAELITSVTQVDNIILVDFVKVCGATAAPHIDLSPVDTS